MSLAQTNITASFSKSTNEMIKEVRENVLITIDVVLKSLQSPSTDTITRRRLGDALAELREIVQYLYTHKAKEELNREAFDYFDIKMAGIIEECGKVPLKSAFA